MLIAAGNRQTRPIPAAPACHHVGPKPLAAIAARATALYLLLGHFALGSAPLSRAPHTNTHSVAVRSASCVRTSASYLDVFSGRSRGIRRTAANQATAVRGPACSCCVKCLSTTPRSCSPAQRRTVKIRTLSRVSSSTASNHCTCACTDKPSCKRRRLVKQLSACVQRSAML